MPTKPLTSRARKLPRAKPPTRKERERLTRHSEIVHAAQAVFAERGFDKATLEEIAERAEFGKGTVYNYFDSKESLFSAAITDIFDDVCQIAQEAASTKQAVRASLATYARRMIEYYRTNHDFCSMLMREWACSEPAQASCRIEEVQARIKSVAEPIARRLKTAMAHKEIKRADPMALSMMFIGLVHHFYIHVASLMRSKTGEGVGAQTDLIITVFFDGIAASGNGGRT